jgi:PAS domain S-box-containing protein
VDSESLLERELLEARQREESYRERLARHSGLAQRLRGHAALLRDALRRAGSGSGWLNVVFQRVAQLSAQALNVERTSIWLFDETREHLVCRHLLSHAGVLLSADKFRAGVDAGGYRLAAAACPGYLSALAANETAALAVSDTRSDTRTAELAEYLSDAGVTALLDIPIVGPGVMRGVFCHEQLGGVRQWTEEEVDFASSVGSLVALALESEQRSQAERSAAGTEAKYRQLVETLPVTVYSYQPRTGELDYVSPRVVDLNGFAPTDYLGTGGLQQWFDSVHPDHRPALLERLSGSDEPVELTYPIRTRGGAERWVRDTCHAVRDASGRVVVIQGTLTDVTAQKEAEEARHLTEVRYQRLLERASFSAIVFGRGGKVEFVNTEFARLVGKPAAELIGADAFELMLSERSRSELKERFLAAAVGDHDMVPSPAIMNTGAGGVRNLLWTTTPVLSVGGSRTGLLCVGVDVTERIAAENQSRERQKLESLGRLAASVAHDFNNYLMVLQGTVDGIAELAGDRAAMADAEHAIRQAKQLTKALLLYARREVTRPVLIELDRLIERNLTLLQTLVGRDLLLQWKLGLSHIRVFMDENQLLQVLMNLVANAAEATRGHGSSVAITTRLAWIDSGEARSRGLIHSGEYAVVAVADDGSGIGADVLPHVFEPFFTTKGAGTGLGLATCASIVSQSGGFITLDTWPGKGTTFGVHFPVVAEPAASR